MHRYGVSHMGQDIDGWPKRHAKQANIAMRWMARTLATTCGFYILMNPKSSIDRPTLVVTLCSSTSCFRYL